MTLIFLNILIIMCVFMVMIVMVGYIIYFAIEKVFYVCLTQ